MRSHWLRSISGLIVLVGVLVVTSNAQADSTAASETPSQELTTTLPSSTAPLSKLPAAEQTPLSFGPITIPEPASVALITLGCVAIFAGRASRGSKRV